MVFVDLERRWLNTVGRLCFLIVLICLTISSTVESNTDHKTVPQVAHLIGDGDQLNGLIREAERLREQQRVESSQEAIEKYRATLELAESQQSFEAAARASRSMGEIYQLLGDLKKAIESFHTAIALSQKAKSEIEEMKARNGLAGASFLKGDSKAAQQNSLAALSLSRALADKNAEAAALSNLGESLYAFGDLPAAQKNQKQAFEIWKQLGDFEGEAISQVALAYYSSKLGEPKAALDYLDQALRAAENINNLHAQLIALNATGNIKAKLGRNQEAIDAYTQAERIAVRTGDRLILASIRGGTGSVHYWLGDTQRALEYYEQSFKIFSELEADWGIAETTLDRGRANNALGNHDKALECLTEALALFRKLGMRRLEVESLRDIGLVKFSVGEYKAALESFEQAVKLSRSGEDYRYRVHALNLIGRVYENLNQPDRAMIAYKEAWPLTQIASYPTGEAETLFNIARLERDQGKLSEAEKNLETAISFAESIRSTVSSQDLRASYVATIHGMYEMYIDVLLLRHKLDPQAGYAARAFAVSEKSRARSFLESLQEGQANVREGVDASLLEKERSLNEALNAKAERHLKLVATKETVEAEKTKLEIDALARDYSLVHDQIRSSSPRYAALTFPEPLSLQQAQQRLLDDDSILIEYALGDLRSYAWLVTRNNVSTFELAPRQQIEDAARKLYSHFVAFQLVPGEAVEQTAARQKKASESIPTDTAALSKLVLAPLAGKLTGKRLLVIPDGALQYLPFQALNDPDASNPRPLLTSHEIINEPSASTLAELLNEAQDRKGASRSVAVFADPVFEEDDPRVKSADQQSTPESTESLQVKQALRDVGLSADGVQIPRLLASSEEAAAIIKYAPWGTGLQAVGFDATRQRVMSGELSSYRVVHFATHGMINNDHPELSGIVLSLFDRQGRSQDGFLRLHDIYNLRLSTDLVVLSACSTGLGKDVRGEGLIGLTRGFMYAGASGVVASLWRVDDQATSELMSRFYEGLFQKGLSPAAALREAQLEMAQQKAWQSPYYWAGFILQGRYDEQLVVGRFSFLTSTRVVMIVSLLGVLLGSVLIYRRRRARTV